VAFATDRPMTWRALLRDSYLTFDRRTLGLTRILLGFYLVMDLFRRTPDWLDMFGDRGVLPTWVILERPQAGNFSLLHGFTSGPELWALWGVILATYLCLLLGYRTKVAQVLSLLLVTSMNGRVLFIENGGYVVQNLVLLWTAFLPLGDRFSLDAMRASMRARRERTADALRDRNGMTTSTWCTRPGRPGTTVRQSTTSSTTIEWRPRWWPPSVPTCRSGSSR
jgi:hypothetical protein